MFSKLTVAFLTLALALVQVNGETHTVTFVNKLVPPSVLISLIDGIGNIDVDMGLSA